MIAGTELNQQSVAPSAQINWRIGAKICIALLVAALVLAGVVGYLTGKIEHVYLKNYPLFFDPGAYNLFNAKLFLDIQTRGQPSALWTELMSNDRFPLRSIP
ncbi:MAG: hypothetical protein ACRD3W_25250, partial [Terriglobales bacterium]